MLLAALFLVDSLTISNCNL